MIWALTNYGSNEFLLSLKQDIILWIHKSCGSVCRRGGRRDTVGKKKKKKKKAVQWLGMLLLFFLIRQYYFRFILEEEFEKLELGPKPHLNSSNKSKINVKLKDIWCMNQLFFFFKGSILYPFAHLYFSSWTPVELFSKISCPKKTIQIFRKRDI